MKRFYSLMQCHLPLGISAETTFRQLAGALGLAAGVSLGAYFNIMAQYNELFYFQGGKRHRFEGMMMPIFGEIAPRWFVLFGVVILGMVLTAVLFYFHHYQGSKSIYTMRRLPNRWELWRRVLTVPAAAALLAFLLHALLLLLCYGFYLWIVPAECLVPGQWTFLLSEMIGGIF